MAATQSLTRADRAKLTRLEQTIDKGLAVWIQVGEALAEIRDSKLYRETHPTFEAYCRDRWNYTKSRAYQLMDGAQIAIECKALGFDVAAESHARQLKTVPKQNRVPVLQLAQDTTAGGRITADAIETAIATLYPKPNVGTPDPHRGGHEGRGEGRPKSCPIDAATVPPGDRHQGDDAATESGADQGTRTTAPEAAQPAAPVPGPFASHVCPCCGGTGQVPITTTIPSRLAECAEFVAAWAEWLQYKRERRQKMPPTTVKRQLTMLDRLGPQKAVLSIHQSIQCGWHGLFAPNQNGKPATAAKRNNGLIFRRGEQQ